MPAISLEIQDTEVPVAGIFIHKGASEPLLEMADHLTCCAQRQYKDQAPGKEPMPEFVAMFPRGAPYAIYRELRLGKMSGGDEPRWQLSFTDDEPAIAQPAWRAREISVGCLVDLASDVGNTVTGAKYEVMGAARSQRPESAETTRTMRLP